MRRPSSRTPPGKVGFELLQWLATFSRDYLLPKLKPSFAVFEKKMAEYADVVAVSAAILQRAGIPAIAQGFWTEHSERPPDSAC